jgi:hypothetical protein
MPQRASHAQVRAGIKPTVTSGNRPKLKLVRFLAPRPPLRAARRARRCKDGQVLR